MSALVSYFSFYAKYVHSMLINSMDEIVRG
jgi:hypothetical protein